MNIKSLQPFQIKKLLDENGFSHIWNNGQGPEESKDVLLRNLRTKLEDQEIQLWGAETSAYVRQRSTEPSVQGELSVIS